MKVDIDLAADSARLSWAPRAKGASRTVSTPGRGVRLLMNDAGDVVGVEVLGWTQRTDAHSDVQVRVHPVDSAERLGDDDPLVRAITTTGVLDTDATGRPRYAGRLMVNLAGAADRLGLERSWLSRELAAGRLQGQKIGREWWTTTEWLDDYRRRRAARSPRRAGDGARTEASDRGRMKIARPSVVHPSRATRRQATPPNSLESSGRPAKTQVKGPPGTRS